MTRPIRLLLLLAPAVLLGALLLAAGPAAGRGPVASAAARCAKHGNHGFSYLYPFHVSGGASCSGGRRVISGYRSCLRHGHSRCTTHRYRCHRKIIASGVIEYDARVACKKGGKRVRFHYTQRK